MDWKLEKEPGTDLPGLLDAYQSLGVPEELIAATSKHGCQARTGSSHEDAVGRTGLTDATRELAPYVWVHPDEER